MLTGWILIVTFIGSTGPQAFSAGPFNTQIKCTEAGITWRVMNRRDLAIVDAPKEVHFFCAQQ